MCPHPHKILCRNIGHRFLYTDEAPATYTVILLWWNVNGAYVRATLIRQSRHCLQISTNQMTSNILALGKMYLRHQNLCPNHGPIAEPAAILFEYEFNSQHKNWWRSAQLILPQPWSHRRAPAVLFEYEFAARGQAHAIVSIFRSCFAILNKSSGAYCLAFSWYTTNSPVTPCYNSTRLHLKLFVYQPKINEAEPTKHLHVLCQFFAKPTYIFSW